MFPALTVCGKSSAYTMIASGRHDCATNTLIGQIALLHMIREEKRYIVQMCDNACENRKPHKRYEAKRPFMTLHTEKNHGGLGWGTHAWE